MSLTACSAVGALAEGWNAEGFSANWARATNTSPQAVSTQRTQRNAESQQNRETGMSDAAELGLSAPLLEIRSVRSRPRLWPA